MAGQGSEIFQILDKYYPGAAIALNFKSPLQLLIAIILAAQCTDERVNEVTGRLFKKYPTPGDYARAQLQELEQDLKSISFYRNKSKNIKAACTMVVNQFNGKVPDNIDDLLKLPGIGRKSANIILNECFNTPAIGVDTHVLRVSRRLAFTKNENPDAVEKDLCGLIPRKKWHRVTRVLTAHGKALCNARKPLCSQCPVEKLCAWRKENPG